MGKNCWMASLALQQLFPTQILLIFLRFELLPNLIFQCYRPQTWQFFLFCPAFSISGIHKVPGLKCKGGQVTSPGPPNCPLCVIVSERLSGLSWNHEPASLFAWRPAWRSPAARMSPLTLLLSVSGGASTKKLRTEKRKAFTRLNSPTQARCLGIRKVTLTIEPEGWLLQTSSPWQRGFS